MAKVPNIKMNNGLLMPGFGLGTFEVRKKCFFFFKFGQFFFVLFESVLLSVKCYISVFIKLTLNKCGKSTNIF